MSSKMPTDDAKAALSVTVYTPDSPLRDPGKMLRGMWRDLLLSRELAWRLIVRDISAQYRQAFLGIAWALIMPMVNTVTWIFLNGAGIVSVSTTDLPYPVYVFTGTMLWQVFSEAFQQPSRQVNAAKAMLSKVNFPKEAIILSGIGQTLFNAAIKVLLLIPTLWFLGIAPGWRLLLLPVGILSLILAGTVLGLLLAPIGALYQDVSQATVLITQFWMYITPVVFSMPESGWVARLFRLNPLTPLIVTARAWLVGSSPGQLSAFLLVNAIFIVVAMLGWVAYRVSLPILVERMSA
jgi:lipopolysaccharide transport system permease protein